MFFHEVLCSVTEHDLQKEFFRQWELKKFYPSYDSHSVFLNMSETSWHLLRLGTWNLKDVFPKHMKFSRCFGESLH